MAKVTITLEDLEDNKIGVSLKTDREDVEYRETVTVEGEEGVERLTSPAELLGLYLMKRYNELAEAVESYTALVKSGEIPTSEG